MTLIDIFLLVPLLWFGFKGAKNGAVMEFVQLAAIIFGVFAASKFSSFLGNFFNFQSEYAGIIYFAITFLAVVGMLFLAGYIITTFIKMIMLGWLNRLLGVVFALAKTVLILSVLIFISTKLTRKKPFFRKKNAMKRYCFAL